MGRLHTYLEAIKKRQLPYDAEVIADAIEQLKEYGSPRTIKELMMSRNVDGYSVDDLLDVILALAPVLRKGAGLHGGGYAYYPNKTLTVWKTSDGGKVRGKMLDIMVNYMFQDADEAAEMLTMEPDYAAEELLIEGDKDQAGYEGYRMRGDRYGRKPELREYELHVWPNKTNRFDNVKPVSKAIMESIKKQISMKFPGNTNITLEKNEKWPEIWVLTFKAPDVKSSIDARDALERQIEPIVKSALGKKAFENREVQFEIDFYK